MLEWAKEISEIRLATPAELAMIGDSPASVWRKKGVVMINPAYLKRLTAEEWKFILYHEAGHLALQSQDEFAVDKWAHEQYMATGASLKQSVFALTRVLDVAGNEEHEQRAEAQLERAQIFDQKNNMNDIEHFKNPAKRAAARLAKIAGQAKDFSRNPIKEGKQYLREGRNAAQNPFATIRKTFLGFDGQTIDQDGIESFHNDKADIDSYNGNAAIDELEHFKRKPGGTKLGNSMRTFSKIAAQVGSLAVPALANLPIGEGLLAKKPAVVAEAVQAAQTPADAARVVNIMAPDLTGQERSMAMKAVQAAQTPADAAQVAKDLTAINAAKLKKYGIIGASVVGAILLVVVIILIAKKK